MLSRGRFWLSTIRQIRLQSSILPKESSSKFILPYIYEIEEDIVFQQQSTEPPSIYFSEAVPIEESLDKISSHSSNGMKSRLTESTQHTLSNSSILTTSSLPLQLSPQLTSSPPSLPSSPPPPPTPGNTTDINVLSLEERQIQIEKRQATYGELESIEMAKKMIQMGRSASIKSVQKIFLQWYEPLYQQLLREKNDFKLGKSKTEDINYFGPVLIQLPLEKVAVIILNTTIDLILRSRNSGVQIAHLANDIAKILQVEKNFSLAQASDRKKKQWLDELSQVSRGKWQKVSLLSKKILQNMEAKEWEPEIKLKIGVSLVSIMLNVCRDHQDCQAFVHDYKECTNNTKHFIGVIRLSDYVNDILLSEVDLFRVGTRYLPMIVPPTPWSYEQIGGYLTHRTNLVRFRSKSQYRAVRTANLQKVYQSLNYLGKIPWKVNKRVLDVMKELYARGELIGGLPSREIIELPPEDAFYVPRSTIKVYSNNSKTDSTSPDSVPSPSPSPSPSTPTPLENSQIENGDELVFDARQYKYQCRRVRQKNSENHSLRCDLEIKISIADEFRNDVIYFPWNVDFRGRAYPVPPNLNHMGADNCRGILYFAVGKPLGKRGFEWLKIHLCNLFGNNKISLQERIQWTESHLADIIDSAENPIDGSRWWTTAEEPYQTLATCIEIAEAMKCPNPETYVCQLPVHQDGSCNGLQHYAALGRDLSGGSAVNLTSADRPQDVYTEVLKRVLVRIQEDADYDPDSPSNLSNVDGTLPESKKVIENIREKNKKFAQLVTGKVDRKVIKQTVMTSVYGVTNIGARDQVHSKLAEKLYPTGTLNQEEEQEALLAASYLAKLTLLSLGDLFSSADEIMNWLANIAAGVGGEGHVMSWITPLGLPVMQPYRRQVDHTVRTILQNITLSYEDESLPVSRQKQRTAFPPNFVHSLDSSHMMMTSLKMEERGLFFTAVHDSFWTHPCDVDVMNEDLRSSFVELYKLPLLESLKESIELRYPSLIIPDVPARGQLDIESVKDSTYFFH